MKKELPILFSTDMVLAILDGRKTQTRRIISPQPIPAPKEGEMYVGLSGMYLANDFIWPHKGKPWLTTVSNKKAGPDNWAKEHGPCTGGDVLYVRETWSEEGFIGNYIYKADGCSLLTDADKWKASIHMPKVAARIWLEVTNVRVERLQDISEDDAMQEGINKQFFHKRGISTPESMEEFGNGYYKKGFKILWQEINGSDSWDANPWVWVIEFKVLSTTGKPDFLNELKNLFSKL